MVVLTATALSATGFWLLYSGPDISSVDELAERLNEAGLGCEEVIDNRPPEQPNDLDVIESGTCQLNGSPKFQGETIGSLIIVFGSEKHLETAFELAVSGQALIIGETWEIYVPDADAARAAASALDGELRMPDEFIDPSDFVTPGPSDFLSPGPSDFLSPGPSDFLSPGITSPAP